MPFRVFITGDALPTQVADAEERLLVCGFPTFVPRRLRIDLYAIRPMNTTSLANLDRAWLPGCGVMMLLGELDGEARNDKDLAFSLSIPVLRSVADICQYYHGTGVYE
jgi:hypothetical protein